MLTKKQSDIQRSWRNSITLRITQLLQPKLNCLFKDKKKLRKIRKIQNKTFLRLYFQIFRINSEIRSSPDITISFIYFLIYTFAIYRHQKSHENIISTNSECSKIIRTNFFVTSTRKFFRVYLFFSSCLAILHLLCFSIQALKCHDGSAVKLFYLFQ